MKTAMKTDDELASHIDELSEIFSEAADGYAIQCVMVACFVVMERALRAASYDADQYKGIRWMIKENVKALMARTAASEGSETLQ
jgi:hypothetical protein